MVRHRNPPSQTWRTSLANHINELVSSDFVVVPTVFFRVLFVFVILSRDRRRPVHIAVTESPTSGWALVNCWKPFRGTAPQSPWQNAYVERWIGSIRRECLDHVMVLNDTGLGRWAASPIKQVFSTF
jgi:hypothetical protein